MPRRDKELVLDDLSIEFDSQPMPTVPRERRRRPRRGGLLLGIGCIALMAGIVWRVAASDEPDRRLGVTTDRLASETAELWSQPLLPPGPATIDALALPSGTIAVSRSQPAQTVSTLDLADGATVWEHEFDPDVEGSRLVAATERTVVVEVYLAGGRRLVGFDSSDGSRRWSTEPERDVAFDSLPGAVPIAEFTFDPDPPFTERLGFLDPDTGRRLGGIGGTIAATDWDGTWYVRAATDELLAYDLRFGWREPVQVATTVPRTVTEVVVTANGVIGIDGRGSLLDVTAHEEIALPAAWRGEIRGIEFVGGPRDDRIVIRSDSRVAGATVSPGAAGVVVEWEADLDMRQLIPTDRGALAVGWSPERSVSVLDAISGDTVVDATDGFEFRLEGPVVLNDGFLLPTADDGLRAYRFDGELLWTVRVDHSFTATDRAVVDFRIDWDGSTVRAIGDRCVPDC